MCIHGQKNTHKEKHTTKLYVTIVKLYFRLCSLFVMTCGYVMIIRCCKPSCFNSSSSVVRCCCCLLFVLFYLFFRFFLSLNVLVLSVMMNKMGALTRDNNKRSKWKWKARGLTGIVFVVVLILKILCSCFISLAVYRKCFAFACFVARLLACFYWRQALHYFGLKETIDALNAETRMTVMPTLFLTLDRETT